MKNFKILLLTFTIALVLTACQKEITNLPTIEKFELASAKQERLQSTSTNVSGQHNLNAQGPHSPDFEPEIVISNSTFSSTLNNANFTIRIKNLKHAPSSGQIILKIPKISAFDFAFLPSTPSNGIWVVSQSSLFWTLTMNQHPVLPAQGTFEIYGNVTLKSNVPPNTNQPMTVTIVNGSGGDSNNNNNTANRLLSYIN